MIDKMEVMISRAARNGENIEEVCDLLVKSYSCAETASLLEKALEGISPYFLEAAMYRSKNENHRAPYPSELQRCKEAGLEIHYQLVKSICGRKPIEYRENGEIVDEAFIKSLSSVKAYRQILSLCIERDDIEAWKKFGTYKPIKRCLDKETFMSELFKKFAPKPGSAIFNSVKNKMASPRDAAVALSRITPKTPLAVIDEFLTDEVVDQYGHFLVYSTLSIANLTASKVGLKLLTEIIQRGGDFFVGFMMQDKSFAYEEFLDRNRDNEFEADHMMKLLESDEKYSFKTSRKNVVSAIKIYGEFKENQPKVSRRREMDMGLDP